MKNKRSVGKGIAIFLGIIGGMFLLVICLSLLVSKKDYMGGQKIAIVRIEGVISASKFVLDQLKMYQENPTVKAIVLRVDSPGGLVAPSQEIYQALAEIKSKGEQKLVVSMGTVAASGGYYVACVADKIVANPGTLTGSIGVIMQFANIEGLFEKIGLSARVIKTGPHKDIGSPVREMTAEEEQILQAVLDDVYDQFLEAIVAGRGMERDKVQTLADGRIFTGRQAKELGLVDELGGINQALELAAELTGITERPLVILEESKPFSLKDLVSIIFENALPEQFQNYGFSLQYRLRMY